jgi:membrane protein DedA with SNARE-associated domain
MEDSLKIAEKGEKDSKKRGYLVGCAALVFAIALCAAVVYYWDYIDRVGQYGYLGVFIINIFAGVTIIVPVPGLLIVFTMGSVLHPAIVGACAGLGEAIGSIIIYLTGYGGRGALKTLNHKYTNRFEEWIHRRGSIAVFLMSAIINPLFYPFTAVAGMMRFGLVRFFFSCWAGKTIKGMAVAYIGYFGLGSILRAIGIGV